MYNYDVAYREFFHRAECGDYDRGFLHDRLQVVSVGAATSCFASARTLFRVVELIVDIAQVCLYATAMYWTMPQLRDNLLLLGLNIAAISALPLQVVINAVAIGVGIISPKAAYWMMHKASLPLTAITTQETYISHHYKTPEVITQLKRRIVSPLIHALEDSSHMVKCAGLTVLFEFSDALSSGIVAPLAFLGPFQLFQANPKELSSEQKEQIPILLLNGNYSHQATFLPLLHAFSESQNKRPIYTINLPPESLISSQASILEKVEEIKRTYGRGEDENFAIDMVGHSMGSSCIQILPSDKPFRLRKIVTIGTPMWQDPKHISDEAFDITGSYDYLSFIKGRLDAEHSKEIETGHLGLLFHPKSLQTIQEVLG